VTDQIKSYKKVLSMSLLSIDLFNDHSYKNILTKCLPDIFKCIDLLEDVDISIIMGKRKPTWHIVLHHCLFMSCDVYFVYSEYIFIGLWDQISQ
jgi:hypothetical protein